MRLPRESASPSSFPPVGPFADAPLSSPGSLGMVPRVHRSYQSATTSHASSRQASVCQPSPPVPCRTSLFAPTVATCRSPRARPLTFAGRPSAPAITHGMHWISQVPGQPSCARPALGPRGGLTRQALTARRCCLRLQNSVGPSQFVFSRLNHAALALAVYASRPGLLQDSRKTRFRLGASLYRAGSRPAGLLRKVSMSRTIRYISPSPRLRLARSA